MNKLRQFLGRFEHATRFLYVNSVTLQNNSILVVEYPKSGGTWLAQLLSGSLGLPFPRNQYPILKRAVYHSHYQPKYLIDKNKHIAWLLRDGRDIMVSSYFHNLVWNDKNKKEPRLVNYYRSNLHFEDYLDIEKNLPKYIDFLFTDQPSKFRFFNHPGNWRDYNLEWLNMSKTSENVHIIRYEDMLKDTKEEVQKLLKNLVPNHKPSDEIINTTVDKYSFENQTKRKKGEENRSSFLRKGISGDWKNYFSEEAKEIFKKHANDILIQLGYEKDGNW